ncbi:MAG: hypothetical protein J5494_01515 [Candidatus Methanomethylophilaceae archaeon]|nr:hypothetical protein [Candidatus Methanomethylophilaceae archaeon]
MSKSKHSIPKGILFAAAALTLYSLIPYALEAILKDPSVIGAESQLSGIDFTGVCGVLERSFRFGFVMCVLYFFAGFYRKGDKTRIYAQTAVMIGSYVWFLYIINFGNLENFAGFDIGDAHVTMDIFITGLLGIMILVNLLKIPVYYGQYVDNREEFMETYDPDAYVLYNADSPDDSVRKTRRRRNR